MSSLEHMDSDYLIAGAGCAGLSLAMQLKRSGLPFSKVIIVDKSRKTTNDRTWCFWTRSAENWFDETVFKTWESFELRQGGYRQAFSLHPYSYQMIRGIDFYAYCLNELKEDKRFVFIEDEILEISANAIEAGLNTPNRRITAKVLFNSVIQTLKTKPGEINYLQHFKGCVIETERPVFKDQVPVFMEFEAREATDCRFFYLVPHSDTKALVEYTGFSKEAWEEAVYDKAIGQYMNRHFPGTVFRTSETERGKIPMFESEFVNPYGPRVVNIGSAGGASKPSTGYTFYFIQKHTEQIIAALRKGRMPEGFRRNSRFGIYDRILLEVLNKQEIPAAGVFLDLFKKNKVQDILAFLNEESSVWQELKIMNSVNKFHFMKAALKKLV